MSSGEVLQVAGLDQISYAARHPGAGPGAGHQAVRVSRAAVKRARLGQLAYVSGSAKSLSLNFKIRFSVNR